MPFTVTSAFATLILNHAAQLGLDLARLRAVAGLDAAPLDHARHLPAEQVERLWHGCAAQGAGADFGCTLAAGIATTSLQGLNILLDSAADLRASLDCLVRLHGKLGNYLAISLETSGDRAELVLRPLVPEMPHPYALDAISLTLVRNMARRSGVPPGQLFDRVQILPRQACAALLRRWGVTPARGDEVRLALDARWLERPLLGRNEFLHHALRQRWEASASAAYGDEALRLARFWLKSSDQPIEQIAARVGYSQASNFIRAFRKQFGITPKQFRLA
ncbi:MAG: helix-turn-helix domain-containing protein [Pseudomonas sp.]